MEKAFEIKSQKYRIKCYHQIYKNNYVAQPMEFENDEVDTNNIYSQENANYVKNDKFTRNELVFIVQLYTVIT